MTYNARVIFAKLEVNDSWLKVIRLTKKKILIMSYKSSIFITVPKNDLKVFEVSIFIAT